MWASYAYKRAAGQCNDALNALSHNVSLNGMHNYDYNSKY